MKFKFWNILLFVAFCLFLASCGGGGGSGGTDSQSPIISENDGSQTGDDGSQTGETNDDYSWANLYSPNASMSETKNSFFSSLATEDGGYLVSSIVKDYAQSTPNYWKLMKLDYQGEKLWERWYNQDVSCRWIQEDPNDAIILFYRPNLNYANEMMMEKINYYGNFLSRTELSSPFERGESTLLFYYLYEENILQFDYSDQFGVCLNYLDLNGNYKSFAGRSGIRQEPIFDHFIKPLKNGYFLLIGSTLKNDTPGEMIDGIFFSKIDDKFYTITENTFPVNIETSFATIVDATEDNWGNFLFLLKDGDQTILVKVDAQGNRVWGKSIDVGTFNTDPISILILANGDYLVTLNDWPHSAIEDGHVVKFFNISQNGNIVWQNILSVPWFHFDACSTIADHLGGFTVFGSVTGMSRYTESKRDTGSPLPEELWTTKGFALYVDEDNNMTLPEEWTKEYDSDNNSSSGTKELSGVISSTGGSFIEIYLTNYAGYDIITHVRDPYTGSFGATGTVKASETRSLGHYPSSFAGTFTILVKRGSDWEYLDEESFSLSPGQRLDATFQ